MNKSDMLTTMAQKTGLTRNTIKDLMKTGWTYEHKMGEPARFVSPEGKLKQNG